MTGQGYLLSKVVEGDLGTGSTFYSMAALFLACHSLSTDSL